MLQSQKLALRRSEVRQRLNELAGVDDLTDELRAEMDTLEGEYRDNERQTRAALIAEGDDGGNRDPEPGDAETRERLELRSRVRIGKYIGAAMAGKGATGAETEYAAACGIEDGFPLHLIAPERETRARRETRATESDVDAGATQAGWLDRMFAGRAAARLGVTFESVAPGTATFPVVETGPTPAQRGRSEAVGSGAQAWTVSANEVKPTRHAARVTFTMEDAARLPGLEEALRRDLRMAVAESIDRAVFVGDAGANENRGDIVGMTGHASVTEVTLTQALKAMPGNTLEAFVSLLDGVYAGQLSDLNVIASVAANSMWSGNLTSTTAEIRSLSQFLRDEGLSWMIRAGIADSTTADGDFGAVVSRAMGLRGAAVAAVWDSGSLIRDPYSDAASGGIALTLNYLWGFALPRPANFARLKFVS